MKIKKIGATLSLLHWVALVPIVVQVLGFARTALVARILGPAAYTEVAVYLLVASTTIALSQIGIRVYLMQKRDLTTDDLNGAWAFEVAKSFIISLIINQFSQEISKALGYSDQTRAVRISALTIFAAGLTSTHQIKFEKELNYSSTPKLILCNGVIDFTIICLALWYENSAFSSIVGLTSAQFIKSAYSHIFYKALPRPTLQKNLVIEISKKYTIPVFTSTALSFLASQLDQLIVGNVLGPSHLSAYQISAFIAATPMVAMSTPISSALFPLLCKTKENKIKFSELIQAALITAFSLSTLILIAFIPLSEPIFNLLLKKHWTFAAPIACILLAAQIFRPILSILETACLSLGKPRQGTQIQAIRLITIMALIPLYNQCETPVQFAVLTLVGSVISTAICITVLTRNNMLAESIPPKKWLIPFLSLIIVNVAISAAVKQLTSNLFITIIGTLINLIFFALSILILEKTTKHKTILRYVK